VASTYCIDYVVQLCKRPHIVHVRTLQSAVPTSHSRYHGPSFHQPGLNPHILNKTVRSVGSVRSPNYTKSPLFSLSFGLASTHNPSYSFEALIASQTVCVLTNIMHEKQISQFVVKQATSSSLFQSVCCRASCARQTCEAVAIFWILIFHYFPQRALRIRTAARIASQMRIITLPTLSAFSRVLGIYVHRLTAISPHLTRDYLPYYITPTLCAKLSTTGPRNAP
jgi:hypothetical protein